MKKIIIGLVVVSAFCGWTATETVDGIAWTYTVSGGEAKVGNNYSPYSAISKSTSGRIVIPSLLGGCPVTKIGYGAFSDCTKLGNIVIPDSVKNIEGTAFVGCSSLISLVIPNSVTNIASEVLSGCSSLKELSVPFIGCNRDDNSLLGYYFGSRSYDGAVRIYQTLNRGWSTEMNVAYYFPEKLRSVVVSDGYALYPGVFDDCSMLTNVTITGNMESIGGYAFYGCGSLISISIPDSVAEIGGSAFEGCKSLECINLPPSLIQIGDKTFYGCSSLKNIKIPNSIKSVGRNVFTGCKELRKVEFENSNTEIHSSLKENQYSFPDCATIVEATIPQSACTLTLANTFPASYQSITNVVILDGVTRIAADCFNGCLGLKKIVIPASVSVIYDNAFKDCVSLEEIVFLGDAPDVGSGIFTGTPRTMKITVKEGSIGWNGGVSTALPEVWPVGDSTARGISYYDDSADISALVPVITPEDGSIFADTCEVSISCAAEGAVIYYRTDGKTPKISDNYLYRGPFTISDTSKIVAVAVKEGFENAYATTTLTKRSVTLAEAAGAADLAFATDGDVKWMPVGDKTADGGVSARSGAIGDDGMSWIEVSVSVRGTLSFKQKVSCEDDPLAADWDHLEVVVDGEEWDELRIDGETDWVDGQIEFTDNDTHTVCWVYTKDDCDSGGKDCAWISCVTWVPADVTVDIGEGKSVVVPVEWIDSHADIVAAAGGDKAAALQRTAANGRKVWECFMLGVDPTKADDDFRITRFWMEDGVPKFEFSHSSDGAGNSFVPRIKPLGKEKLSDSWQEVPSGGNSSFRFFTVEVELP